MYELTELGRGLEEPVLALGRWGARTLGARDGRPLRSQWLALAVKSFTERNADGFEAVVELRLEDGAYALRYAAARSTSPRAMPTGRTSSWRPGTTRWSRS